MLDSPTCPQTKEPPRAPVDSPDAEIQTALSSKPCQSEYGSLTSSSWAQLYPPPSLWIPLP